MQFFSRLALSLIFVTAGVMHFHSAPTYLKIMPSMLPFPLFLIYFSGAAEIAGGLGIWPHQTRKLAGWGLIALLVAVFPANIHMALSGTESVGINIPRAIWWARLPFQAAFIWWVWFSCLKDQNDYSQRN